MFKAFKTGGYDGWYVIEAFGRALPALAAATRVWRDFFPTREEVYRFGHDSCAEAPDAKARGRDHEDDQGPGDVPRPVRRRPGAVQQLEVDLRLGRSARLQGRADPDLGRPRSSTSRRRPRARPIATRSRAPPPSTASRSPSCRRTCRASSSRSIRPMTTPSTPSPRPTVRGNPKARQEWAVDQVKLRRQGVAQSGPRRARHLLRRAGLALPLSLAAAAGRAWSRRPSTNWPGAGQPILDVFDEARRRCLLRDPSGRGPLDGVTFEMFLERGRQPPALQHPLRPVALRAAAARLSRVHRHLPRAHQGVSRQGRRVQSDRPAGRLSGYQTWVEPRRPLPLAGRRPGGFRRRSSPSSPQYDYDGWAVLEWECASSIPRTAPREGAAVHRSSHIIRVTEKAFDDFAAGGTDKAANRRMLGLEPDQREAMTMAMTERRRQPAARIRLGMVGGGRVHSSAPSTAWPRGWTTTTSWWPALSRPRRRRAKARRRTRAAPDRCYGSYAEMAQTGSAAEGRHRSRRRS